MIVILLISFVYVTSVIVTLAYYTDNVKTSMVAKAMGSAKYMSCAALVALIPILNTIVALTAVYQNYFVPNKHKILLMHELENFERLNKKKLVQLQKEAVQLQKEAESRIFKMDPQFWCFVNEVAYYESQSFEEYWKELNHLS